MITCKYCGTELDYIGEYQNEMYFYCPYCDLSFEKGETCQDRQRKQAVPDFYDKGYYRPTKELLKCNTIVLFHLLRDCRKDWYELYSFLRKLINIKDNEIPNENEVEKAFLPLYHEYIQLTKQKFVIENILLEKVGFIPEKITDSFLSDLIEKGKKASYKPMYIYISKP